MSVLSVFSDAISLYPLISEVSESIQQAIIYVIAGIILINLLCLILSLWEGKLQGAFRTISFHFTDYMSGIFYIPAAGNSLNLKIGALLLTMRCTNSPSGWLNYLHNDSICGSVDDIPVIISSSIGFIILMIQVTIYKLSSHDIQMTPSNFFAELTGSYNVTFHLARSILLIFFTVIPDVIQVNIFRLEFPLFIL